MRISTYVMTKGISDLKLNNTKFNHFVYECLHKFQCYHWGDVCEEDGLLNDTALETGERIIAVYETDLIAAGRIWIIADAEDDEGKRVLTILLPSEY